MADTTTPATTGASSSSWFGSFGDLSKNLGGLLSSAAPLVTAFNGGGTKPATPNASPGQIKVNPTPTSGGMSTTTIILIVAGAVVALLGGFLLLRSSKGK